MYRLRLKLLSVVCCALILSTSTDAVATPVALPVIVQVAAKGAPVAKGTQSGKQDQDKQVQDKQEQDTDQRQKKIRGQARRYRKILDRRPQLGTAFRLWFQLHVDNGQTESLIAELKTAAAKRGDTVAPMLLALVYDQMSETAKAEEAYKLAKQRRPQDYYPIGQLAKLYQRQRKYDQAEAAIDKALALKPPESSYIELLKLLGEMQHRQRKHTAALATWSKLADEFASDTGVLLDIANVLSQKTLFGEAIKRLQQVQKLRSTTSRQRVALQVQVGQLMVRDRRAEEAIKVLDETLDGLLAASARGRQVRRMIRQACIQQGQIANYVRYCRQRLKQHPEDIDTRLMLAQTLQFWPQATAEDAEKELKLVLRQAPSRADVRLAYAQLLEQQRRWRDADQFYADSLKKLPGDGQLMRRWGWAKLKQTGEAVKQAEAAAEIWKRIADQRPQDAVLAVEIAQLCVQGSRWGAVATTPKPAKTPPESSKLEQQAFTGQRPLLHTAEQLFLRACKLESNKPLYFDRCGQFYFGQRLGGWAEAMWQRAAATIRSPVERQRFLASVYTRHGLSEQAIASLQKVLKQQPRSLPDRFRLIDLLSSTKQLPAALQVTEAGMRLEPKSLQLIERRLELLVSTKRHSAALRDLKKRFLDEESLPQHEQQQLLLMLISSQDYSTAATVAEGLVADDALASWVWERQAEIALGMGKSKEAIRIYEKLFANAEGMAMEYGSVLVDLYTQNDKLAAADRISRQLVQRNPGSLVALELRYRLLGVMKQRQEAIRVLQRAVSIAPSNIALRQQLADDLVRDGRMAVASEHLWYLLEHAREFSELQPVTRKLLKVYASMGRKKEMLERLYDVVYRQDFDGPAADDRRRNLSLIWSNLLESQGDLAGAASALRQYLSVCQPEESILKRLVDLLLRQKQWKQAIAVQQQLISLASDQDRAEQKLAEIYVLSGDTRNAISVRRRMILAAETSVSTVQLVDDELSWAQFRPAQQLIDLGLRRFPSDWQLTLRQAYTHIGLREEALAMNATAAALDVLKANVTEVPIQVTTKSPNARFRPVGATGYPVRSKHFDVVRAMKTRFFALQQRNIAKMPTRVRYTATAKLRRQLTSHYAAARPQTELEGMIDAVTTRLLYLRLRPPATRSKFTAPKKSWQLDEIAWAKGRLDRLYALSVVMVDLGMHQHLPEIFAQIEQLDKRLMWPHIGRLLMDWNQTMASSGDVAAARQQQLLKDFDLVRRRNGPLATSLRPYLIRGLLNVDEALATEQAGKLVQESSDPDALRDHAVLAVVFGNDDLLGAILNRIVAMYEQSLPNRAEAMLRARLCDLMAEIGYLRGLEQERLGTRMPSALRNQLFQQLAVMSTSARPDVAVVFTSRRNFRAGLVGRLQTEVLMGRRGSKAASWYSKRSVEVVRDHSREVQIRSQLSRKTWMVDTRFPQEDDWPAVSIPIAVQQLARAEVRCRTAAATTEWIRQQLAKQEAVLESQSQSGEEAKRQQAISEQWMRILIEWLYALNERKAGLKLVQQLAERNPNQLGVQNYCLKAEIAEKEWASAWTRWRAVRQGLLKSEVTGNTVEQVRFERLRGVIVNQ